jgi:hypothetical protein
VKLKTDPYRKQHLHLAHFATALPTNDVIEDPNAAHAALFRVRAVLVVHIRLENGLLYPWMLQRSSESVCERVRRHRDDMGQLLTSFLKVCAQWSTAASIAEDPQGFVAAWKDVRALLFAHMAAEQDDLYDLADACMSERLALAS